MQLCKVNVVQHNLAADSHSVEKVTVSYFCWGSQGRELHELAMQTALAGILLLRHCLASARMLVLLKLVMAALLPVGISILPIQIGMLPTVVAMLPIAISVLPIAIVMLALTKILLLIAILLLAHHVLLVQITTRTTLVPIRLTWMLAKIICICQVQSWFVSAAWLLMRQARGRILKVALSVAKLRLLPGALRKPFRLLPTARGRL